MANTASTIRKLERAMPVMDKRRQQQQQAARDIQLQQSVAQAPAGTTAQQLGTQAATAAGQQAVTNEASQQQQRSQLAQAELQSQATQAGERQVAEQAGLQREQIAVGSELAKQQLQNIDQIAQDQMEFKRDEIGRVQYQETQLIDFAIATAESEEELQNRLQDIEWASRQETAMMEAINNRLKTLLSGEQSAELQKYSQEQQAELVRYQRDLEDNLREKQEKAARNGAIFGGIGTIIGAYYGGPAGAKAGGEAGSAAGGAT